MTDITPITPPAAEPAEAAPPAEATPPTPPSRATFDVLPLSREVRETLAEIGYQHPTPVQIAVWEPATRGKDAVVQARTGTGKTAAFGLPIVDHIVRRSVPQVQVLALCPTRELALQVSAEIERLGKRRGIKVSAVYGGAAMQRQITELAEGAQVVVGTPGRVLDHLRRGTLDPRHVRMLVLDEADEMLSMGFEREVTAILDSLPKDRQTVLFSATLPPDIERMAKKLRAPEYVTLSGDHVGALEIEHFVYMVGGDKLAALTKVIEVENPESAVVFCNTKDETERVAQVLCRHGYDADWLNGDLPQGDREKVMSATREGRLRFLVATDVAARGIDISHLTHVINYDFPQDSESYVHRTGRTGRAGRTGTAIALITPHDIGGLYLLRLTYKIRPIERQVPSEGEIKTRAEADLVSMLVEAFAPSAGGTAVHADDLALARRLLTHEQADVIFAGLLRDHLGARPTVKQEAAAARRATRAPAPKPRFAPPPVTMGDPKRVPQTPPVTMGDPKRVPQTPPVTTGAPAVTTGAPAVTTAGPAVTTGAPAVTTAGPAVTTGAPAVTPQAHPAPRRAPEPPRVAERPRHEPAVAHAPQAAAAVPSHPETPRPPQAAPPPPAARAPEPGPRDRRPDDRRGRDRDDRGRGPRPEAPPPPRRPRREDYVPVSAATGTHEGSHDPRQVPTRHADFSTWQPPAEEGDDEPILGSEEETPRPTPSAGPRTADPRRRFDRGERSERGDRGERGEQGRSRPVGDGRDRPRPVEPAAAPAEGAAEANDADYAEIYVNVGRRDGARAADFQQILIDRAGLLREHVRRIRVRERNAFVSVRRDDLAKALGALGGASIAGKVAMAEQARERGAEGEPGADEAGRSPAAASPEAGQIAVPAQVSIEEDGPPTPSVPFVPPTSNASPVYASLPAAEEARTAGHIDLGPTSTQTGSAPPRLASSDDAEPTGRRGA